MEKYVNSDMTLIAKKKEGGFHTLLEDKNDYLFQQYGIRSFVDLSLSQKDVCTLCGKHATTMAIGEYWEIDENYHLTCPTCVEAREPVVITRSPEAKEPHIIAQLIQSIRAHQDYSKLNKRTQNEVATLQTKRKRSVDDNMYLRELWRFLYHAQ
jgi:hypothetical protein